MNAGGRRPRVLFISADPVGERMAGLGIRYTELAGVLANHAEVTVAHGGSSGGPLASGIPTVAYRPHDPGPLRALIDTADVVVCHPQWPLVTSWLRRSAARVVFDLYDPETLETLELFAGRPTMYRRLMGQTTLDRLHGALRTGHHFMCASEKQRDLWLGALLAMRLIDPPRYDADPSLQTTIAAVPFGVPADPPAPGPGADAGPRQTFSHVGEADELVLWNGGLWRWLDAETAVRAVCALAERRPGVRLVFMGGSTQPAAVAATEQAREAARGLDALGGTVLFHEGWVPYDERQAWLAQANCALSTHRGHLETRFAFRTRLLDCFWAGLPVVCTRGDDLADRVERERLGVTVPEGDASAVAVAIETVLDEGRRSYAAALAGAAADYAWPRVAGPLVRWVTTGEELPPRPGDTPGAVGPGAGQRFRDLAYLVAGRRLLASRPDGGPG